MNFQRQLQVPFACVCALRVQCPDARDVAKWTRRWLAFVLRWFKNFHFCTTDVKMFKTTSYFQAETSKRNCHSLDLKNQAQTSTFSCSVCGSSFQSTASLKRHLKTHTGLWKLVATFQVALLSDSRVVVRLSSCCIWPLPTLSMMPPSTLRSRFVY